MAEFLTYRLKSIIEFPIFFVTPAHRGKGRKKEIEQCDEADTSFTKKRGMTWRNA